MSDLFRVFKIFLAEGKIKGGSSLLGFSLFVVVVLLEELALGIAPAKCRGRAPVELMFCMLG